MRPVDRLVHTGNAVVDVVLTVAHLPARGGDVVATSSTTAAGGGVNVMVAAARLGLPTVYAGAHGTGPHGDLVRAALGADGVTVAGAVDPHRDTGFVVALVEPDGERSFVTGPGAEAELTEVAVRPEARDAVHVSGYSLVYEPTRAAITRLMRALDPQATLTFDPGPLVAELDPVALDTVLARADWVTLNAREAGLLTGAGDPSTAADRLRDRCPQARVIVRLGAQGAVLADADERRLVPSPRVRVVDANGAGDAHTGAVLAGLATGLTPVEAVAQANRAAAYAVTRVGPATGPTVAQLAGFG